MIKKNIAEIFNQQNVPVSRVDYIFCSDDFLKDINARFLDHNFYTDVITFPLHEPGQSVLGEIYISVDRVRENATAYYTSFENEMLRVVFHGALHLCGYKDKTTFQKNEMKEKENYYLERYFVSQKTVS